MFVFFESYIYKQKFNKVKSTTDKPLVIMAITIIVIVMTYSIRFGKAILTIKAMLLLTDQIVRQAR